MHRDMLIACLPWVGLIVVGVGALRLLAFLCGAQLRPGRLRALPQDQVGSVQSLSFVLTLPLFILVMMFIVQMSQLAIGTIVVHYAAYAAARSAIVWIPARVYTSRPENPEDPENTFSESGGLTDAKATDRERTKFGPIARAAALACVSISPSREVTGGRIKPEMTKALLAMYKALSPQSEENARIPIRLRNKLAYSLEHTSFNVTLFHKSDEPPMGIYEEDKDLLALTPPFLGDDKYELYTPGKFYPRIGWQDPITVTIYYEFALLPGPGRLLARRADVPGGVGTAARIDTVADQIGRKDNEYVYQIEASATLGNEGERSVLPYAYQADEIRE